MTIKNKNKPHESGTWNDFPCNYQRPFACEIPGIPTADADISNIHLADLNGDGMPDIGFANSDAPNTLFFLIPTGDPE